MYQKESVTHIVAIEFSEYGVVTNVNYYYYTFFLLPNMESIYIKVYCRSSIEKGISFLFFAR